MSDQTSILKLLKEERGFDFSGYRESMLSRRIQRRIIATELPNPNAYLEYLEKNNTEYDKLINVLTINGSTFFRNPFLYEFITEFLLPNLVSGKKSSQDQSLRIWSAGCSYGEEPYSMAILIKEYVEKEKQRLNTIIIANDIDKNALVNAKEAIYSFEKVKNIKYSLLEKTFVPPESIFGALDIVLCRNLLIYYNPDFQEKVFDKLYRSLKINGILILGEAEVPTKNFHSKFKRLNNYCKIYQKVF